MALERDEGEIDLLGLKLSNATVVGFFALTVCCCFIYMVMCTALLLKRREAAMKHEEKLNMISFYMERKFCEDADDNKRIAGETHRFYF